MTKLKMALLLILAVVLGDFAYENLQALPVIHLFKFELGTLPVFALVYISVVVGILIGWLGHFRRTRRKRREAASAAALTAQEEQKTA